MDDASPDNGPIARRYGLQAAREWEQLLAYFDLAEGFGLIVLLVPDAQAAALCRLQLTRFLAAREQSVVTLDAADPQRLRALAATLLDTPRPPDAGAVWLESVTQLADAAHAGWDSAWRRLLAGLNQQRNPMRERLPCPLVIVAAPWLVPLFRDTAPDLWSVRTLVTRLQPMATERPADGPETRRGERLLQREPVGAAPDPSLALREAERFRGAAGHERDLAAMLERAGGGYFARGDLPAAEGLFREAFDLRHAFDTPAAAGDTLHNLARAVLDQDRAAEAEALFRRALALKEEGGDTLVSRGITLGLLARAVRDQGRAAEAEALFRRALALKEEGGATPVSRGITMDELARAVLDQGRAAEAEALFRRALAEEGGDTPVSRGITLDMLARAVRDQGRAAEAEALFRRALALKEEGGATPVSRGITLDELARAVLDQGRAAEAEALFRRALALKEEGGATPVSRGITLDMLARAVLDQGRAAEAEAEALFRRALALKEEGGDTPVSRGITLHELARAVRDQGRAAEAEALFRRALALKEEGGDTPVSRGITLHELARAVRDQGRAAEAEALFRRALALFEAGDAPEGWQDHVRQQIARIAAVGAPPP